MPATLEGSPLSLAGGKVSGSNVVKARCTRPSPPAQPWCATRGPGCSRSAETFAQSHSLIAPPREDRPTREDCLLPRWQLN
jgi:hypothetical protein